MTARYRGEHPTPGVWPPLPQASEKSPPPAERKPPRAPGDVTAIARQAAVAAGMEPGRAGASEQAARASRRRRPLAKLALLLACGTLGFFVGHLLLAGAHNTESSLPSTPRQ